MNPNQGSGYYRDTSRWQETSGSVICRAPGHPSSSMELAMHRRFGASFDIPADLHQR
jgi:hypothetical protein